MNEKIIRNIKYYSLVLDMDNIVFREAIVSDINSIHELNKKCLPLYYSRLEYVMMMINDGYIIMVALNNNNIIGYVIGEFTNKNLHILSIGIDSNCRGNGIGTDLINSLIKKIENNCTTITLYVHIENNKAIKFYEKNGFIKDKLLKNYYCGQLNAKSQDAIKMIKYIKKFVTIKNKNKN